ncbi:MAG: hypothetical protein EBE86_026000 [Hormoscilla sp. GUM202]|nr:hypothetical protein [Hormoscilla sp. GUM202]
MIQAVSKEQTILERLQTLTPQQQQSVLDFIEFLQFKTPKQEILETVEDEEEVISMGEAAKEFIGCLDSGVGDLSMKKQELKKGYQAI